MRCGPVLMFASFACVASVGCGFRSLNDYSKNQTHNDAGPGQPDVINVSVSPDAPSEQRAPDGPRAEAGGDGREAGQAGEAGALAQGATCTRGTECRSGQCVDGVCCESACSGTCEACNGATPGSCVPVMGAPHGGRAACPGTGACQGQCDGIDPARCKSPGSEVQCAAGGCAGGTATTPSVCTGAGACSTPMTVACPSNLCADTTRCSGGCDATHPCATTQFCDTTGVCLAKKANGTQCLAASECATGNCVDGVCCESACAGQCQACAEPTMAGKCLTVTGAPRAGRTACAGSSAACRGTCNGTLATACTFPGATTSCAAASCLNAQLTPASVCDGAGGCTRPAAAACHSNQCADATQCLDACGATKPCGAGTYCDATGICQPKKANSATCVTTAECSTGNCADGVCCDSACTGQCESCSEPTLAGKCTPVSGNPRGTRNACAGAAPCKGTCGGTDGTKCRFPAAEVACAAGTCLNGSATTATACNGAGACTAPTTMPCASNLCADALRCSGGCSATNPCPTNQFCNSVGTCVAKKANASACQLGPECTSGNCADGVCCDLACSGQCEACAEPTSLGQCVAVSGAPRGVRVACTGSTCRGACNATLRTACTYPGSQTVCAAATCANAMGTTASVCNGLGACTTATTSACRANQCLDATTCLTTCSATQPCMAGRYCDTTGICQLKKANGLACALGTECTNGNCVDGLCCESACTGPCLSCALTATLGLCRAIISRDDTDLVACPGTCDAGGLCKSKRAQTCQTTAGGCVAGTTCADGFCCDRACTGACEVCSATPGTCTFVAGAPRTGHTACAGTGVCGGTCLGLLATCTVPAATVSCRAAMCASGTLTNAATCDGAGTCPAVTTRGCAPFVCNGTAACFATCTSNSQCAAGAACVGNVCTVCTAGQTVCANACANLATADAHCGVCGHNCQGGGCIDGVCQAKLIAAVPSAGAEAAFMVQAGTKMYIELAGRAIGPGVNNVFEVSKDGSQPTGVPVRMALPAGNKTPVTALDGALYWTFGTSDGLSYTLQTCLPASCATSRTVATRTVAPNFMLVFANVLIADPTNHQLVLMETQQGFLTEPDIMRVTPAGVVQPITSLGLSPSFNGLATPNNRPDRFFFFDQTNGAVPAYISTSVANAIPIPLTPAALPGFGQSFMANDTTVYWGNLDLNFANPTVTRAPLPNGILTGAAPLFYPGNINGVVDATTAFGSFSGTPADAVSRCPLSSCVPVAIARGQSSPFNFLTDDVAVYWLAFGNGATLPLNVFAAVK